MHFQYYHYDVLKQVTRNSSALALGLRVNYIFK